MCRAQIGTVSEETAVCDEDDGRGRRGKKEGWGWGGGGEATNTLVSEQNGRKTYTGAPMFGQHRRRRTQFNAMPSLSLYKHPKMANVLHHTPEVRNFAHNRGGQ